MTVFRLRRSNQHKKAMPLPRREKPSEEEDRLAGITKEQRDKIDKGQLTTAHGYAANFRKKIHKGLLGLGRVSILDRIGDASSVELVEQLLANMKREAAGASRSTVAKWERAAAARIAFLKEHQSAPPAFHLNILDAGKAHTGGR